MYQPHATLTDIVLFWFYFAPYIISTGVHLYCCRLLATALLHHDHIFHSASYTLLSYPL